MHYGKSYRWFRYFRLLQVLATSFTHSCNRFSCCAKVFPCDKYVSPSQEYLLESAAPFGCNLSLMMILN